MARTLEELEAAVEDGSVDTVLLAMTDMQGRLQGKRLDAGHFVHEVAEHGAEACNYLLAVDVEMNTVGGYAMSSWDRGYGDFELVPDFGTLRPVPWLPGTVLCLADVRWGDGSDVVASPRQVLRRQLDRLAERGWVANAGTELEFILFRDSYEQAWHKDYVGLEPANLYNVDYSLLGTSRVEPLIRRIRLAMAGAGLRVEDSKGECNLGQHEINFRYGPALRTADEHAIYKNGSKEIAAQEGYAITFMAKYDAREGSSCHIHLSLADDDGTPLFGSDEELLRRFLAGMLEHLRETTYLLAPNVNSYKRFAEGSFAPTAIAWGDDNRTCAFRVIGHGAGRRVECRVGGADLNPYLAIAGLVAAGLGRHRPRAGAARARAGQRLRRRPRARAGHAAAGARRVRGLGLRPRGVRRRGRRPLRQLRRRRAHGVQRGGHRLGAPPRLRAPLRRSRPRRARRCGEKRTPPLDCRTVRS